MDPKTVLRVSHRSIYRYSAPVETAQHLATMRPRDCPWQQVLEHTQRIEPVPSYRHTRIDVFGNEIVHFALDAPHSQLTMTSETTVRLSPRWATLDPDVSTPWEEVVGAMRFCAGEPFLPEAEFCFASPNIALRPDLRAYALESFAPGMPVLRGAFDLMHRLHADLRYEAASTVVDTPAHQAFTMKRGVCQDFAQVAIGCLRSLGLPARYVSGYLRTVPPDGHQRLIGADASHAWLALYCPRIGWVDLDPTNDVLADVDHVTLAIGRDYSDVSLLRGVILGGGAHTVEVAVNVAPVGNASVGDAPVSPAPPA
jgi:transglutaminase-like putative cysteine protease